MFSNPRYLTCGVNREVPLDLQLLLWQLIDELRVKESQGQFQLDYLQVFDLKITDGSTNQLIIHRQEIPEYKQEYRITVGIPVEARIFVIDNPSDIEGESYSTMLLASEY